MCSRFCRAAWTGYRTLCMVLFLAVKEIGPTSHKWFHRCPMHQLWQKVLGMLHSCITSRWRALVHILGGGLGRLRLTNEENRDRALRLAPEDDNAASILRGYELNFDGVGCFARSSLSFASHLSPGVDPVEFICSAPD